MYCSTISFVLLTRTQQADAWSKCFKLSLYFWMSSLRNILNPPSIYVLYGFIWAALVFLIISIPEDSLEAWEYAAQPPPSPRQMAKSGCPSIHWPHLLAVVISEWVLSTCKSWFNRSNVEMVQISFQIMTCLNLTGRNSHGLTLSIHFGLYDCTCSVILMLLCSFNKIFPFRIIFFILHAQQFAWLIKMLWVRPKWWTVSLT